jgi:proteic killer suppression protein
MIRSFRGEYTLPFCEGKLVPEFERFRKQAEKRLRLLEAATSLQDLFQLQSAGIQFGEGDPKGKYSLMIRGEWRVFFEWPEGAAGPERVKIGHGR